MGRWARPPMPREQLVLFERKLDEAVPESHPVRLFDELLAAQDWSPWEQRYVLVVGQPPVHPRVVASVILYGLSRGVRGSRRLEYACGNSVDYMWLAEGRVLDHSTICKFRTGFGPELKALLRGIGRVGIEMGVARLNLVALDGTRVRANSSRHKTATRKTLEERLAALDEQIERMFAEADRADEKERDLFGETVSPNRLPKELATLRRRQERLAKALAAVKAKEANAGSSAKKTGKACEEAEGEKGEGKEGDKGPEGTKGHGAQATPKHEEAPEAAQGTPDRGGAKRAPRVPVADPESTLQPNKDGGYAPNYTPLAAVDGHGGLILEADVLADSDEGAVTVPMMDGIKEGHGAYPGQLAADTAHGSGSNLSALEARGIEAFIPLEQRVDHDGNPAHRADPLEAVPEAQWDALPRNARTKRLDRSAFLYDAESDSYRCPMGHRLGFAGTQKKTRRKGTTLYRLYRRASGCRGCPLQAECVKSQTGRRTVFRGEHEALREDMDARLSTAAGRTTYARRKWAAETPFGHMKTRMNFRQFLLRGIENVRVEWLWACTAYNVMKLVRALAGAPELVAELRG